MLKKSKKVAAVVAVVACVSAEQALAQHGLGSAPGNEAPQLIMRDGIRVWNNPGAFGTVPKDQYDRGVKVCSAMNTHGPTSFLLATTPRPKTTRVLNTKVVASSACKASRDPIARGLLKRF